MIRTALALSACLAFSTLFPAVGSPQEIGPASGSLIAAGGAVREPAIFERFIELAGGPGASVVVIPTAGEGDYDQSWPGVQLFKSMGAKKVTVLHTRDRELADSPRFVRPLQKAQGVWFSGGRQWRLADAYLGSLVHDELARLLARGGVIGGSSAGATILGSYLARGDTRTNTIMMGDHEEGFGFLRRVAIDQHVLARNRHFDLLEIVEARPDLLGLGIDENTAIVVQRDAFEVIGRSFVAVYDSQHSIDSGGSFYFLAPGDRFDLVTRKATRGGEPLERVVDRGWPNAGRAEAEASDSQP